MIYITKNGDENDRSFQTLKHLLKMPYITVRKKKAIETVDELILAKSFYFFDKREHLEDKIADEQKEDMCNKILHKKDFNYEILHTLILFDDISNSNLSQMKNHFLVNN